MASQTGAGRAPLSGDTPDPSCNNNQSELSIVTIDQSEMAQYYDIDSHLPMVMAVFSSNVLGVLGLLMMVMRGPRMGGMYPAMPSPSLTEISPAAQVALLHTEMYSGFRLPDKMGMKSKDECYITGVYD